MADSKIASCSKLLLPFVVEDVDREGKPFTIDMEVATIVSLAEAERKKPGVLGGPSEKLSFVSKIHYPFWAVPWEDKCLIIDGLGFSTLNDEYFEPPDIKLFVEDLRRASYIQEEFRNTLRKHAETFKDFVATAKFSFRGVVAKKGFSDALFEYIKDAIAVSKDSRSVLAPLEFEREAALETCERLVQHWRRLQADIKGFQYALNVLDYETKLNKEGILREIEQIREKHINEISPLKSDVEKKVEKLRKKQEAGIALIAKAAEKKIKAAAGKKEKHELRMQTLKRKMAFLQKKVGAPKRKGGRSEAARWSHELQMCQSEIQRISAEIKAVSLLIEHTEKEKKDAVRELGEKYRNMVEKEEARITDLVVLQDREIRGKQSKLEELLLASSHIDNLIEQLTERKKLQASRLREETSVSWKRDETTLVCLPFYLLRYEGDGEARYHVYPPAVATDYKGILRGVQKAIRSFDLESRINLLFRPRLKELGDLLSSALIRKMREDKAFEEEMLAICGSNDLLGSTDFKELLTRGITELAKEGWIKPSESDAIIRRYGGI